MFRIFELQYLRAFLSNTGYKIGQIAIIFKRFRNLKLQSFEFKFELKRGQMNHTDNELDGSNINLLQVNRAQSQFTHQTRQNDNNQQVGYMDGKSIDLVSDKSDELNFDQYIKQRENFGKQATVGNFKQARRSTQDLKTHHNTDTKSMKPPKQTGGKIAPFHEIHDLTNISGLDSKDSNIEPLAFSKMSRKGGKSQGGKSLKSSRSLRSQPEVKKASGVEVVTLKEEDLPPPRDTHQYRSRNDAQHDDELSQCSHEKEDEDELMNKTSHAYLEKMKDKLEKELLRTELMIEAEKQKKALGAKSDQDVKPNKRFKYYNDVFSGLTRSKQVKTQDPMINCLITYNSKSAVTITKKNDHISLIHQFSLETCAMTFVEEVGGRKNENDEFISYIKCNEIEQNPDGTIFSVCYLDDGRFYLRIFFGYGPERRSQEEILEHELDINERLGLNNYTMPINNFPDPFIDCTFINDDLLFVNLFHNKDIRHHHFFYYWKEKRIVRHTILKIDSSPKNFPTKCFYNTEYNEIYTFYRQGQSYRIPVFEIDCKANKENEKLKNDYYYQDIFDRDLGQMFLVNETALVTRSSSQILFFRQVVDEFTGLREWLNYHTIDEGGNLFYIKGNKRVQIITDEKIYFYTVDLKTYEVVLENQMNNFMNCSVMMFGPRVRYCITYKSNEQSFDIYRKKFVHDYKVNTVDLNLDGSRGLPVETMDSFLVSKVDEIMFYDLFSFKELVDCRIKVPLLPSTTREPNQIISMQTSKCENFLAVITGKNLIKAEQKPNQIFVYKRVKNLNVAADVADKFELIRRVIVKDEPEFTKISMQFMFKNTKYEREPDTLVFARQDKIIQLNFMKSDSNGADIADLALFDMPLLSQPEFFLMTEDQHIAIIATPQDGIYFNMENGMWVDLDECYDIGSIKEIIHEADTRQIYILANKHQEKMGVFLIKFHENNPKNFNFFMKYKTMLDVSDADIAIMKNKKTGLKELIVSFKTVTENTYNVYIVDISQNEPIPLFRHESFQLWETQITAFFIKKTNDYVTINQDGISLISLDSFDKRYIKSADGQEKMIHAIESVNYLKVDPKNFIHFDFAGPNKKLRIVQQFKREGKNGKETAYEDIFSLRIHDITLRELLFFQSLYVCATQTDILNLVKSQYNPMIFYKTFLELDGTNMVSILAFDSRCMQALLREENLEYFTPEHPLFYKNKIQKSNDKEKFFYRSAIDMAYETNQLTACGCIIKYIVSHQNNFVSSFLFKNNIIKLMQKGVNLSELFNSRVFNYTFDYDEWPSTHSVRDSKSRSYNGNLFEIRDKYTEIFPEPRFAIPDENKEQDKGQKIYKIAYKINILSQSGEYWEWDADEPQNRDVSFMEECYNSSELELFNSEAIKDIMHHKWKSFAIKFHMVGCAAHFFYIFMLFNYINQIYINYNIEHATLMNVLLASGLMYPLIYEFYQVKRHGYNYLKDYNNINDQLYVWCGLVNLLSNEYQAFGTKMILTIILFQQILKTFFYLRIFATLSYIVTMIFQVVKDLQAFLIFFFILVGLFAMVFAVLGGGNPLQPGEFKDFYDRCIEEEDTDDVSGPCEEIPNEEYEMIGLLLGNFFYTLRTGIGDFDFGASYYLNHEENWTFFIMWFIVVVVLCIIFLNFIIAEASASYAKVVENLAALQNKEKASLIMEAESMIPDKFKTPDILPKYIIIRQEDN